MSKSTSADFSSAVGVTVEFLGVGGWARDLSRLRLVSGGVDADATVEGAVIFERLRYCFLENH